MNRLTISRAALYTKVKSILGIGVSSYINDQRLNAAKRLLETTQLPVVEVDEKVGFANQSYFSTLFKQYFGSTPSKYRAMQA
ncbi:helix-turn-helix transcriptional regulator [Saccharicrinis carchari]|uniref:helix-turn-helix transcriptional regulator n=1 Tax=Saccharicrinis carchari TaxID=1168039 RepID=UPI00163DCE6C|nr:helix-turn-helix transcriptional regulator [Saccharicrinis carchari]